MMVMVLYYVFSLKDTVEIVRYQSMSLFQMKKDKSNLISFSEVSYFQSSKHFFIWNLACKIASRNSTPCDDDEFILNGQRTDAIRINLSPKDDFTAIVDCVGILKLRNAGIFSHNIWDFQFFFWKFEFIFWKILKTSRTSPNRSHSQSQNAEIQQSVWLFMPLSQILIQVNQICHWWLHQTQ